MAARAQPARSREKIASEREPGLVHGLAVSCRPEEGHRLCASAALSPEARTASAGRIPRVREPAGHAHPEQLAPQDVLDPYDASGLRQVDHGRGRPAGRSEIISALGILDAEALGRGFGVKLSLRVEQRRDVAEEAYASRPQGRDVAGRPKDRGLRRGGNRACARALPPARSAPVARPQGRDLDPGSERGSSGRRVAPIPPRASIQAPSKVQSRGDGGLPMNPCMLATTAGASTPQPMTTSRGTAQTVQEGRRFGESRGGYRRSCPRRTSNPWSRRRQGSDRSSVRSRGRDACREPRGPRAGLSGRAGRSAPRSRIPARRARRLGGAGRDLRWSRSARRKAEGSHPASGRPC